MEKICSKCGEILPEDSEFCTKCGTKLEDMENMQLTPAKTNGINKKYIKRILVSVILLIIVILAVNVIQASSLKKELKRDWSAIEGKDGAYITRILEFSEDEIEYRLETGYKWMDMTIATYDYKVISGNKIRVNIYGDTWKTFTVEFNEDKTMMIVSPSLTSIDREEYWFNFH